MPPKSLFAMGETVRLQSTKEMGRVDREPVLQAGEFWYRVRFGNRLENVVEEDLEALLDPNETLESLAARAGWGNLRAFRTALSVERILHSNQSTVYAFRAQRVLFEAFQYKPLLKMLESPDRRLLIADEVGLGKTIETGLILAEMEARQPLDRVLVVCPSRLRDKWRSEMSRKFGHEFDIYARKDLDDYLEKLRRNPGRPRLRAVVSMQTLRNGELRERFLAEVGSIDLLIVDEAHHARNPSSETSAMLRETCEIASAVLLLTATPLHLGTRDLFTLLSALRPAEFRDYAVFDHRLRQHGPIYEAATWVRTQTEEGLARARGILRELFVERVRAGNREPHAIGVIEDMEASAVRDRRAWVELERRVQDLHLLASVITRTRKRDVQELAAVRVARVFACKWTPEENEAYQKLVHGSRRLGWFDQRMSLGQIQKARQAASCLPAALSASWQTARDDDEAAELTDIPPATLDGVTLPADPAPPEGPPRLVGPDSKFDKLVEVLRLIDAEEPSAKVLIFTYFVGTSRYLQEQLGERGYRALRIAGDVRSDPKDPARDDRGNRMREFREDPNIRVLVSTEVGSEGLDFQFCHYLVNYDLPWNPMVVEQRIGRIDRFGQKSPRVHVLNLVVEGTVEDRILLRLYNRIKIFEQSIGQLEAILGEAISELQKDYVGGRLTPEEAEARVSQAAGAIERRRIDLEEVERKAGDLFGHEEYLKDQLNRVGRLGRYISEKSMMAVIESFLQKLQTPVRAWEESPGVYGLRLTDELKRKIQGAAGPDNVWLDRSVDGQLSFCFDGERAYHDPRVDLVNVSHPLLKAAVEEVKAQFGDAAARTAKGSIALGPGEDEEIEAGEYFVLVFCHIVDSIRPRRVLETVAWSAARGAALPAETGERLMHLVQERAAEWELARPAPALDRATWAIMEGEARARNRQLLESEQRENDTQYVRRKGVLEAEYQHGMQAKRARLATARAKGSTRVIPAMEGQLQKADALFRSRLEQLAEAKKVRCRLSEPIAACLVSVARAGK